MPYLTPEELPEDDACRPLFIPAAPEWFAIVSGALTELTKAWNWQQEGAVTVAEAVARMQLMIDAYYDGCSSGDCELPMGGKIIRIGADGEMEMLEDGEWVTPTGDYLIPPPAEREGGTPDDQICLAAKNAVNVLHELYTSLSDSFGDDLTEAAALVAFIGVGVGILGAAFAPITYSIYAFAAAFWGWLYSALAYLTADLWNEDFSKQIECFLVACATNTGGVVTFDWECFNAQLNSLADGFSLTELQIRLYLQVAFLLQFIGGADGLNLAGGTTEITDGDCTACATHCHVFDFRADDWGWTPGYPGFAPPAAYISVWSSAEGWKADTATHIYNGFYLDIDPCTVLDINVQWDGGTGSPAACGNISLELHLAGTQVGLDTTTESWNPTGELRIAGSIAADRIIVSGNNCASTEFAFYRLEITYIGDEQFGGDNCS